MFRASPGMGYASLHNINLPLTVSHILALTQIFTDS